MTTLSYTVPVAGSTLNSVADPEVATALTSILTWGNGNLDGANVVASLTGRRLIAQQMQSFQQSSAAGTYFADQQLGFLSGTNSSRGFQWVYIDPLNYAVVGKSNTQLIVRFQLLCNTVAPGVNFTAQLSTFTIAGSGGVYNPTVASTVTGSQVAINTPSASTPAVVETSAFTFPAAGAYALTVSCSGTTASGSVVPTIVQLFVLNS